MAAWSLTFEAFINIVYAVIARHLTTGGRIALVVASAAALLWLIAVNGGIGGGNDQKGWGFGFVRVHIPSSSASSSIASALR